MLLLCALGLTAACANGTNVATPPATLSVGIAQPVPGFAPDTAIAQVTRLLGSATLVTMARDGRALPALAERWTLSDDHLTWRFFLRRDLTFHDGSPLTADAVVTALAPDESERGTIGVMPGLRDIRRVVASSTHEVLIELGQPSSLLLEAVALVPILGGSSGTDTPGPYRLAERQPGLAVMTAFPGFYRGRPLVDRVEVRAYTTPRTAWGAMMRGEVNFLYEVAPEAVEFVQAGRDVRAYTFLRPYTYVVGFNMAHPILGRVEIRRALDLAVDRSVVIERALDGLGVSATGHVSPRHWTYDAATTPPRVDPTAAAAALDAAGLPPPPSTGELPLDRSPSRFRFTCLVPANYPIFERIALVVQKQLSDVGVDMHISAVPLQELQKRLAAGDFEAYLFELLAGQGLNWPYWFWHSAAKGEGWIASNYRAADEALDHIRLARTDAEMKAAVREFDAVLRRDPPGLFLAWGRTARAVNRRFEVPDEPDRDILSSLPQWRIQPTGQGGT